MEERHDEFEEREGVLRCKYCGSVKYDFYVTGDTFLTTDKSNKFYVFKDGKQYKFYLGH